MSNHIFEWGDYKLVVNEDAQHLQYPGKHHISLYEKIDGEWVKVHRVLSFKFEIPEGSYTYPKITVIKN